MGKNDFESRAGYRQGSVGSIEQGDGGGITHRPGLFSLENAKLEQHDFLWVISFKQTALFSEKQAPPDQIDSSGTALPQLQVAFIPAIYGKELTVNTTGVCRQHNVWRASAHLQKRPVQSCRYTVWLWLTAGNACRHWCLFGPITADL